MMYRLLLTSVLSSSLLVEALLVAPGRTVQLFTAQSDGKVSTLALTERSQKFSLKVTSVSPDCKTNPATLNLDFDKRILYCLDRGKDSSPAGTLNSLRIDDQGKLESIASVSAHGSSVAAEIFDVPGTGVRGYVTASYNKSAIGVYTLGENGALSKPLQSIFPTLKKPGPTPEKQDRSYLHHVIKDPKNKFVLITDLGGDMIRVFTYNKDKFVPLKESAPLVTPAGTGPRHAVFSKSESGDLFLFFNGEIDQQIHSYRITYTESGLSWEKAFSIPSLSEEPPAGTAPTSEIALSPDGRFIIVSNRDISYKDSKQFKSGPSDTLSVFAVNADGSLKRIQQTPSGGYSPRQFSINKAGDKIAVGHQNNKTVVIWKRDIASGKIITEAKGTPLAVVSLTGAVVFTQWDE